MSTVIRKPPGKAVQGFKVILKGKGGLWSILFQRLFNRNDYRVRYAIGRWARPHKGCGPLCVFDSLGAAQRFKKRCMGISRSPVFRCLYIPSRERYIYFPDSGCLLGRQRRRLAGLPCETRLAKAVKLLGKAK